MLVKILVLLIFLVGHTISVEKFAGKVRVSKLIINPIIYAIDSVGQMHGYVFGI
jgi:hypothetical protein